MARTIPCADRSTDDPAEDVADLIQAVSRRMRHAARHQLEPLGLTPAQARTLRLVARAGGPTRMRDLAGHLRIAPRSATSVVDQLARRGLVCRCDDPTDRRVVGVEITADGAARLSQLRRQRRAIGARLLAPLSTAELAQLRDLLHRIDADHE